jgi:hypothetical protein
MVEKTIIDPFGTYDESVKNRNEATLVATNQNIDPSSIISNTESQNYNSKQALKDITTFDKTSRSLYEQGKKERRIRKNY